jgi:hypothetical protein
MQTIQTLKWTVTAAVLTAMAATVHAAEIKGVVNYESDPPRPRRIRTDADPKCAEMHADEPLTTEDVLVNDNGTLRNVFVYIKSGLEGKTFEPPKEPVVLDQKACRYSPRVFGMQARQPLLIRNSDDTLHNVHAVPSVPGNREFNIGQPVKNMETTRTFTNPEIMIRFKCDVHPWMGAYLGVLNHPFFDTTGETGAFSLKNLPAGDYEIEAWHERFGTQTQTVKIAEGETKEITFTFKAE